MKYTIEAMRSFQVVGFERVISNKTAYQDCPAFWAETVGTYMAPITQHGGPATELERAICSNSIGELGVCICNENNTFRYFVAGFYQGGPVPEGLTLFTFPEMEWAKFTTHGKMPQSLQALNTELFTKWMPENEAYDFAMGANIEWYSTGDMNSDDYECGIWVPVRKKNNGPAK